MAQSNIIMYTTEDGVTKIEVTFDHDTVWLSIDQMAELFQRDKSVIGKHVRNIFKEGELVKEAVWAKFAYTASDGKTYQVDFYNLDVIISVGYRVKSLRGTQFRIWATSILKEYMKKGFALDDDRLKNLGGGNYFDELLARIRDIRSSEKVFWRKVLEIYATSIDYDPKAESSIIFFKQVQNKMHWAAHKHTAAEVICQRANADKDNMGLTSWAGREIKRSDVEKTPVSLGWRYNIATCLVLQGFGNLYSICLKVKVCQCEGEKLAKTHAGIEKKLQGGVCA